MFGYVKLLEMNTSLHIFVIYYFNIIESMAKLFIRIQVYFNLHITNKVKYNTATVNLN